MLSAKDMRGLYAILPTPAKEGADRLDARGTVDTEETERVINALIGEGVSGLIVLGTTGECATLTRADYDTFVECVLEVVNRRIPTFIGTTALGGHEVAARMQFIRERGADGALLGLPMWQPLTTKSALDFYKEVSALFRDTAVMVYANARAFRYSFPMEFWEAVAREAPTVMSAKYSRPKNLNELIAVTRERVHFVPNETTVHDFFTKAPATTTACWSTAASMGPAPALAIMDAILRNDADAVKSIGADLAWANAPLKDVLENPEVFASFNIQIEKIRINEAGYCASGPIRPPYGHLPEEYEAASRECGRRWASLCKKYARAGGRRAEALG